MGKGRDDFTQATIRKAAGRVGYRCSFPGCSKATIGASMESNDKIANVGVAAHICAAAKGGPRYDENMTVEERKSSDNCIWLCQTHAKLIDSDEEKYTVGKLRQWKAEAEEAASEALASDDFLAEYYKSNGENISALKQIFDDLVTEGEFDVLYKMLTQYKTALSELYEEFILCYKIVYDTYCDRTQLENHLNEYCNLPCKNEVDTLVELFMVFHLNNELSRVIGFCKCEVLKEYAEMALNNELINTLLVPVGSSETVEIPLDLSDIVPKYITNYIIQNKIVAAVDSTGEKYAISSEEFYYRIMKSVYEISGTAVYGRNSFEEILSGSDFLFIRDNIEKIVQLDILLQEYIWGRLLAFLTEDSQLFDKYYKHCPEVLKQTSLIKKAYYISQIKWNIDSVDCEEILKFASDTDEDIVLCMYLSCLERDKAIAFLEDHRYLYKKSISYLKLRLELTPDIQPKDACEILEKYNSTYENDFTFKILLLKYSNEEQDQSENLDWIKTRENEISAYNIHDYIYTMAKYQCWDELIELSYRMLTYEYMFIIANYLAKSDNNAHKEIINKLYQRLVDVGWQRKGLHFNHGVIQKQLGEFEEAKRSFKVEYDLYENLNALKALIELRYMLNEYTRDEYFDKFKNCIDAHSQNLVAAIYLKGHSYLDARKYFLRSLLLMGDDNPSLNGFCQTISHLPSEEPSTIGANTFVTLKNKTEYRYIALHESDIMKELESICDFANYEHYSVEDVKVTSILFAGKGDFVEFDADKYEVEMIVSANVAIERFFFSTLNSKENVMTINTSDPQVAIEQITDILRKSSEDLKQRIDEYNNLEIRSPLSLFGKNIGKGNLKTCEFLAFENSEKIKNNLATVDEIGKSTAFVLSYDAIVYLTHLNVDRTLVDDLDLVCTVQVKNQLINDINDELSDLTNSNRTAMMFYEDGKVSLVETTQDIRRARYSFLAKLKSFIDSLHVVDSTAMFLSSRSKMKDELNSIFADENLYSESSSLGLVQSTSDAVLVTDDQFVYIVANEEGIKNIGLTGLFSKINLSWEKLLSASKSMQLMNFGNYLPVHLYKQIVDQMLNDNADDNEASKKIQEWIMSDTDKAPTSHHEDVIISLCREVILNNLDYLNPNGFLLDIAISAFERRNPGFIKQCIDEALNSLMVDDSSENV